MDIKKAYFNLRSQSLSLVSLLLRITYWRLKNNLGTPFAIFIFYSNFLPRAKKINGNAYVGITDMVEDKPKADFYSFTQKDVIFYPDNENPGKSYHKPPPQ